MTEVHVKHEYLDICGNMHTSITHHAMHTIFYYQHYKENSHRHHDTKTKKTLTQSKAYLILPITMCERFHNMKEPDTSICQLSHSIKGDMLTY